MVIDSSIWLEILRDGPLAAKCQKAMQADLLKQQIRVPSLVIFEIYRKLKSRVNEEDALKAVAMMSGYEVLDLTRAVSLLAGDLSLQYKLPTADAIVLAHASHLGDVLLTLDNDFSGLPGARVLR